MAKNEADARLPRFAVPAIILIHKGSLREFCRVVAKLTAARNANGKVVKKDMRPMLWEAWERTGRHDASRIASKL